MKLYLSASYGRKEQVRAYADFLKSIGHEIVSRWVFADNEDLGEEATAIEDVDDVEMAEIFIEFLEDPKTTGCQTGGRHTEMGIALHMNIPIFVFGQPENVFHHHPQVIVLPFSWPNP